MTLSMLSGPFATGTDMPGCCALADCCSPMQRKSSRFNKTVRTGNQAFIEGQTRISRTAVAPALTASSGTISLPGIEGLNSYACAGDASHLWRAPPSSVWKLDPLKADQI